MSDRALNQQETSTLDFEYKVKRARRKSIGIYVQDGLVEVRAPRYVNLGEIAAFVTDEAQWVRKKLLEAHQKSIEKPKLTHGQEFLFYGQVRTLNFQPGESEVYEDGNYIVISHNLFTDIEELFTDWVKTQAQQYLDERILELAEYMDVADVVSEIKYKRTKSKWGHCTSEGKLQFNWLIMLAPPDVIDYVVIHELAHMYYLDHSKQFWSLVGEYCPNYATHKKWLNTNQHRLWFD